LLPSSATGRAPGDPWWLGRPSAAAALATALACLGLASAAGWLAARRSPLVARSLLPLASLDAREVFLTTLLDDPQRVMVTTRRSRTTAHRGEAAPAGSRYWIQRYGDPNRPELPDRILLTSRSRGARLLVPVGALDLESALASPVGVEEEASNGKGGSVPSELVHLHADRLYAGTYLELRFPDRERDAQGQPRRFDLVAVRGNRVRSADFALLPNPRYYRAALVEGGMPRGELRASELPGGPELVFALYENPARPAESLRLPISLFDELGLAWGDEVPTLVDDRWRIEPLPRYASAPASPALRERVARMVALHVAARLESRAERERLARAVSAWLAVRS
jgi:hypothetical protein